MSYLPKNTVHGVHISSYQGVCVEAEIPPEVSELFETLRGEALRRAMDCSGIWWCKCGFPFVFAFFFA